MIISLSDTHYFNKKRNMTAPSSKILSRQGKIIKTRYVVMKLSEKYLYKDVYERCLA